MLDALLWYFSDFLMYSPESYARMRWQYRQAIGPLPLLTWLAGAALLWWLHRPSRHSDRVISLVLALGWLGIGILFHGRYFSTINHAAWGFAGLFVLQGGLLLLLGGQRRHLCYAPPQGALGRMAQVLLLISLLGYPLWHIGLGGDWRQSPVVGVSADPTVLFTLGCLLLASPRRSWYLMLLPLFWCLLRGATAIVQHSGY